MTVDGAALKKALNYYRNGHGELQSHEWVEEFQIVFQAACQHLDTLPKVKMVEVWHVECVVRTGMGDAAIYTPLVSVCASSAIRDRILAERTGCPLFSCIRVTGPHAHQVPST